MKAANDIFVHSYINYSTLHTRGKVPSHADDRITGGPHFTPWRAAHGARVPLLQPVHDARRVEHVPTRLELVHLLAVDPVVQADGAGLPEAAVGVLGAVVHPDVVVQQVGAQVLQLLRLRLHVPVLQPSAPPSRNRPPHTNDARAREHAHEHEAACTPTTPINRIARC